MDIAVVADTFSVTKPERGRLCANYSSDVVANRKLIYLSKLKFAIVPSAKVMTTQLGKYHDLTVKRGNEKGINNENIQHISHSTTHREMGADRVIIFFRQCRIPLKAKEILR